MFTFYCIFTELFRQPQLPVFYSVFIKAERCTEATFEFPNYNVDVGKLMEMGALSH